MDDDEDDDIIDEDDDEDETGIGLLCRYVIHSGSVQMNRSFHHSYTGSCWDLRHEEIIEIFIFDFCQDLTCY